MIQGSFSWLIVSAALGLPAADDPCRSGLQPSQRPGPYASIVSWGSQRGQSHCFICETAERPAVVVFAREPSQALGKFAQQLDKALVDPKNSELRSWITFLNADQPGFDPKVVEWAKKHGLRHVACSIFEDAGGPPTYLLARDADVTALFFVKQKVVANFAFRPGELTEAKIEAMVKSLPRILGDKK